MNRSMSSPSTPSDMQALERAIRLAVEAHAGQTDKAGAPYILHPLRVMERVRAACSGGQTGLPKAVVNRPGFAEEAAVTAVLHDLVEDTDVTLDQIERVFGAAVREAVDALSRREGEDYEAFVERACRNPIGLCVKHADALDNLSRTALLDEPDRGRLEEKYATALLRVEQLRAEWRSGSGRVGLGEPDEAGTEPRGSLDPERDEAGS